MKEFELLLSKQSLQGTTVTKPSRTFQRVSFAPTNVQTNWSLGLTGTNYVPSGFRLAIKGKVIAEEIVVKLNDNGGGLNSGWPDFVFDKKYKKMTFLEKEEYYKKEKHLPHISSSKEIEKNGLAVSTVMAGITQNVEENTIDIVELYKMMQKLEKENKELKEKLEKLEKKK